MSLQFESVLPLELYNLQMLKKKFHLDLHEGLVAISKIRMYRFIIHNKISLLVKPNPVVFYVLLNKYRMHAHVSIFLETLNMLH